MKKALSVLSFLLLAGCCSDAFAADEFGSRFGDSSPYALGNTMGKATDSTAGIGMDDLNTIAPAAGPEAEVLPDPAPEQNEFNALSPAAGGEGVDSEAQSDLENDAAAELPPPSDAPVNTQPPAPTELPAP